MLDDFEVLLKTAINNKLAVEISTHSTALEDTYSEINLTKDKFETASKKLLLFPIKGIFVLFSRYCFRLTPNEVEVLFDIEKASGYLFYYRKLLSFALNCKENHIISNSSMETVCMLSLKRYMDEELYNSNNQTIIYHPQFIKLMRKLTKTVAVAACVLVMTFSTAMIANADFREMVVSWVVDTFEKYSVFELKNNTSQTIEELQKYVPTYIPSRFKLIETINQQGLILYDYIADNSDKMAVFMSLSNSRTYVDTENISTDEIEMFDSTAYYFVKDDVQHLVFEKDGYTFIIYGSLEKSELMEVADNIQKK